MFNNMVIIYKIRVINKEILFSTKIKRQIFHINNNNNNNNLDMIKNKNFMEVFHVK